MNTSALALSSLLVLASALVVPPWRTRHNAGAYARAVRALSVLTLTAALGATAWIVLQVLSLGVDHTSGSHGHAWVHGVPIAVIPLAMLIVALGGVEGLIRMHRPLTLPAGIPRAPIDDEIAERFPSGAYGEPAGAAPVVEIKARWTRLLEEQVRLDGRTREAGPCVTGASTTTDPAAALRRVSETCASVTDGLEALRVERPILGNAIALLAQHAANRPRPCTGNAPVAEIVAVDAEPSFDTRPRPVNNHVTPVPMYPPGVARTSVERLQARLRGASRKAWARVGRRLAGRELSG